MVFELRGSDLVGLFIKFVSLFRMLLPLCAYVVEVGWLKCLNKNFVLVVFGYKRNACKGNLMS